MSLLLNGTEWSRAAQLSSASQELENYEASKLVDGQPSSVFRAGSLGSDIIATYSLANTTRMANCMSLLYHNGTTLGSIRYQLATSLSNLDNDVNLFDSALGFGTRLRMNGNGVADLPATASRLMSSSFTIELWVTFEEPGVGGIYKVKVSGGGGIEARLQVNAEGRFVFFAFESGQSDLGVVVSDSIFLPGVRYHVACVFNDAANLSVLYVDGVAEGAVGSVATDMCDGDIVDFGFSLNGGNFKGSIDEFRVWDDVRSASEINDNKDAEISAGSSNLTVYCKFNDKRGATFEDEKDGSNPGSVNTNSFEFPDRLVPRPFTGDGAAFDSRWLWAHQYTLIDGPSVNAQWLRFEVLDDTNPANVFQAGVLAVGDAFVPANSWIIGSNPFGFIDTSIFVESAGGQTFVRNRAIKRRVRLLVKQEVDVDFYATKQWYNLNYFNGGSHPVVVVADTNSRYVQENTIYGLMNLDLSINNVAYKIAQQTFALTELV